VRIQEFCVGLVTEFSRIRLPRIPSLNGIALSPDQVAEDKKLCDALRVYCVEVAPRADLTKLDLLFSITRERIRGPGQRINYRVWNFFAHILREVPVTDKNGEIKFVPATYPMIYKLITSPNLKLKTKSRKLKEASQSRLAMGEATSAKRRGNNLNPKASQSLQVPLRTMTG